MNKYGENELASLVPQEQRIAANGKGPSYIPLEGDSLIVLTIEELRECCIAIVKEWVTETSDGSFIDVEVSEDLDKYLTSKRN